MEVIEKIISHRRADRFKIYALGDIHAGSVHCAESEIKKMVEQIKSESKSYWLGMGDMADSILKNDPRFDITGCPNWLHKDNIIEDQRQWIVNLFKPIAPKCLAYLTGNHEEEMHQRFDNDITRNIVKDLDVPYGGYSCFIALKFRRGKGKNDGKEGGGAPAHQIIIHAWHGAGAAQTEGSQVMRLMRLVNDVQAHIYLMGHLHSVAQYSPERLIYANGRIRSVRLLASITGSWLKAYNQPDEGQQLNPSYAEKKGYRPSHIGCPVVNLYPDRQIFSIES